MSDYAFVANRARKLFASVAKLEDDFARDPFSNTIRINLASAKKLAEKARKELYRLAEVNNIEVCKYRLIPRTDDGYALASVAKSFLTYQNLFSQIYDKFKSGKKVRARIGTEALQESQLEFGYSYSGSLGVVLLAQTERDLFAARLDEPIEALYQVLDVTSSDDVREIAQSMGNAVVKRMYDWSEANAEGGFATDVKWNRSDGRQLGQVIERDRMQEIVKLIDAASEEREKPINLGGTLVGIDTERRHFHFVANEMSYTGRLADDFAADGEIVVPKVYRAAMVETKRYRFAIEKVETRYALKRLTPV